MKARVFLGSVLLMVLSVTMPTALHAQTNASSTLDTIVNQVETNVQTLLATATPTPAFEEPLATSTAPHATTDTATVPAATSTAVVFNCSTTTITRTLIIGMKGKDVEELQRILSGDDSSYTGGVTGYFGKKTFDAVVRFQKRYGVLQTGIVGPITRSFISSHCGTTLTTYIGVEGKEHTNAHGSFWTPFKKVLQWFVNVQSNTSIDTPTITSFTGPAFLLINQAGQWDVIATDQDGGQLTYDVNWGDTAPSDSDLIQQIANAPLTTQASSTLTIEHTYTKSGTYTITITVKDAAGLSGQASATITVGDTSAPTVATTNELCAADAKRCPDGSWVGRTGQDCTFVCSTSASSTTNTPSLPDYVKIIGTDCSQEAAKLTVFVSKGTTVEGKSGWVATTDETATLTCKNKVWVDLTNSGL